MPALLVLGVALLSPVAFGEEDERPVAKAGREALRLIEAGDKEALAELTTQIDPDPWLIADWLLTQGEEKAALALAGVGRGPENKRMAEYVASRKGRKEEEGAREALRKAHDVSTAGKWGEVLPLLEPFAAREMSVVSVQIQFGRGISARALGRRDRAITELEDAYRTASKIGWIAVESQILQWGAQTALESRDTTKGIAFANARVALEMACQRPAKEADARLQLARLLRAANDPASAFEALRPAPALHREAGQEAELAKTLVTLAMAAADAGAPLLGLPHARESLAIYEKLEDAEGIADVLIALGSLYETTSEYHRSKTFLVRALAHTRRHGLRHYEARALAHLGVAYMTLGEYPAALRSYEESLAIDRERKNQKGIAAGIHNLAVLYEALGDLARARRLFLDVLDQWVALDNAMGIASTSTNLAVMDAEDGRLDEAAARLDRALRIYRKAGDRGGIARVLGARASLDLRRNDLDAAERGFRDAVALYLRMHARASVLLTHAQLGFVLARQGKSEEAGQLLGPALDEARALRSPHIEAEVLGIIAQAHLELGQNEKALQVCESALVSTWRLMGGLGEGESAAARERHSTVFDLGALAALRLKAPLKVVKFLEASRAGSLLESLGGRDALRWVVLPEELLEAETQARVAEAEAAEAYRATARSTDPRTRREAAAVLEQASTRLRDVIIRIQRTAKAEAGLSYPRPAPVSEMRRHLTDDGAFVMYGICRKLVIAAVVTRGRTEIIPVGPLAEVQAACEALGRPALDVDAGPALARLRALLVDPLELGAAVKQVLVSPAGPLCYLPFGALFDQPAALTPSGTTHAALSEERWTRGRQVLALGDPAYGDASGHAAQVYLRGPHLTRLPATGVEAKAVGDVVLLGEKASEAELRAGLPKQSRWRAVHFACHGRVDRDRPTRCALALTPGKEDDGFLTAIEVLQMKIPADLAVLSACETGSGKVVKGEGIVGLVRSFMFAGAPRVIASLWKVDDNATQVLMTKFYELWKGAEDKPGLGAAAALRQAQDFVRTHPDHPEWKHPYYWAAWVLWGLPS